MSNDDSHRQRYLNCPLDLATLAPIEDFGAAVWTDYDGDSPYGDYVVGGLNSAVEWRSYEPGIGEVGPWTGSGDANTQYHHSDHLGTLRLRTASSGAADATRVFSAFGERLAGPAPPDRYGYVGAHGYQAHEEFPFLHLGARYYDPASGRFMQRDPIGIEGGENVFGYVDGSPMDDIDPDGLLPMDAGRSWDDRIKESYEEAKRKSEGEFGKGKGKEHRKKRPSTKEKHTQAEGHSSQKKSKARIRLERQGRWVPRGGSNRGFFGIPSCMIEPMPTRVSPREGHWY